MRRAHRHRRFAFALSGESNMRNRMSWPLRAAWLLGIGLTGCGEWGKWEASETGGGNQQPGQDGTSAGGSSADRVASGAGAGSTPGGGTASGGSGAASASGGAAGSPGPSGGAGGQGVAASGAGAGSTPGGGTASGGSGAASASGAAAGSPGPSGGAGGQGNQSCAPETTTNDDASHATPLAFRSEVKACLQTANDQDFYQFTAASTPAQGQCLLVKITSVGAAGGVRATVWSAADDAKVMMGADALSAYGDAGKNAYLWFNAQAGATFRLQIDAYGTPSGAVPYSLVIEDTPVPDQYEPNDNLAGAKPITVGTPVQAYMLAGNEYSSGIPATAWDDWYQLTLPTQTASVALTNLAPELTGQVTLYDGLGTQLGGKYSSTGGSSVVYERPVTAGDYYVKVSPWFPPDVGGGGSPILPAYVTQPYTLTVSVK
jgi:hypothetical protein